MPWIPSASLGDQTALQLHTVQPLKSKFFRIQGLKGEIQH